MSSFSKRQFVDGAMALTVSTALVKIIGLVYKIPLMRFLGAEGMGYFNSAYELYTLFFVVSTSGIPVAISIMISSNLAAGRLKNADKIYKSAVWLLFLMGLIGSLVMCFGADALSCAIDNPKAAKSLVFVAPTVFFISISGAVRGYFQGCRNMMPTAVSQVVESLGKLVLGLSFAAVACKKGLPVEEVSAFAILGLSVGTAISAAYLCLCKTRFKFTLDSILLESECDKRTHTYKELFKLAVPVTVSSILVSLTRIIDMTVLLNRLSESDKVAVYGSYSAMSLPIYNVPSALVAGIALAMVPSISAAVKQGNKEREKQLVPSGIKLCAIISLPIGLGIGLYSEQILNFIFPKEQYAVGVASPLLSALGTSVFASCLVQVTNSVLQANGKIVHPIISMLAGLVVKTLSAYVLIGNPRIGAIGAPISTLLCNLTAVGLNLWFLSRALQLDVALDKCLFKPCACAVTAIFLSLAPYLGALKFGASEKTAFLAAAVFCAAIYFLSIVVCGVFDSEERDFFKLSKRKVIK